MKENDEENNNEAIGILDPTPRYLLVDYQKRLLLNDGYVPLIKEIDDEIAKDFLYDFHYVARKFDTITIIICCIGGEVYPGLLIYNTILDAIKKGKTVIGEVRGLASSMGADILQQCSIRRAYKMSRILIHACGKTGIAEGDVFKQEDEVNELKKLNEMFTQMIAEKTGKDPKTLNKMWARKEIWFSAEEAKAFGLIDEII